MLDTGGGGGVAGQKKGYWLATAPEGGGTGMYFEIIRLIHMRKNQPKLLMHLYFFLNLRLAVRENAMICMHFTLKV